MYYNTKIAEGKTPREARRCLKRRLADHIWRTMTADQRDERRARKDTRGATHKPSGTGSTPTASSSDKSLPMPANRDSTDAPPSRLTNTEAPTGTDLSVHSSAELAAVAAELNDRPRKRLAFHKPIELIGGLVWQRPPKSANRYARQAR